MPLSHLGSAPPPQVSHTRPEEITFRIRQTFKVGVSQPAAVSVYEYYDGEPLGKVEKRLDKFQLKDEWTSQLL